MTLVTYLYTPLSEDSTQGTVTAGRSIKHDGHYITVDGYHYKTSDGKYYTVKE